MIFRAAPRNLSLETLVTVGLITKRSIENETVKTWLAVKN